MAGLIHVGAWTGQEYLDAPPSPLLLFEPQAAAFEELKANCPQALLINAAAGAVVGEATMYTVHPSHSSSLLEPDRAHKDYSGKTEAVRITTVDTWAEEGAFTGLRIDTQGYELEVLKGATRTLKDISRVEIEVHDPGAYPGAASLSELDDFLAQFGFKRTSFDTENSDDLGDAVYERA